MPHSGEQRDRHELTGLQIASGFRPRDPSDTLGPNQFVVMTAEEYMEGCPKGSAAFLIECAATVNQLDERVDITRYLAANIRPKLIKRDAARGVANTVDHILNRVAFVVHQARSLGQVAIDMIGAERELVLTDDAVAYDVLKLLSKRPVEPEKMFEGDETELRAGLWSVLTMADQQFDLALEDRIGSQTPNSGPYVKYFAGDLLAKMMDTSSSEMSPELSRLKDSFEIVKAVNRSDNEQAVEEMLRPDVLLRWPPALREYIRLGSSNLMMDFSRNSGARNRYLADNLLAFYRPEPKDFNRATKDLATSLQKGQKPRHQIKSEAVANRAEERRARQTEAVGRTATGAEQERAPNKLYIYAGGKVLNETDEGFMAAVVEGIEQTYRGDRRLRDDMPTILDFLRELKMSGEKVSGIKTMSSRMKQFELKPSEANGLSTTSANAKKLRVIFRLGENNGIQIMETVMRRELPRVLGRNRN